MFRSLAFAVALALTAAAPARAEETGSVEARAFDLFDRSEAAYRAGRFAEAAQLLRDAYALKPEPVLLYNLARAYEGMGDLDRAVKAYADYLAADPNAKDRASIESRIATLKKQIADRDAARRTPPPPEKKPSPVPWIVAGTGVLGVGAGAVLGLLSAKRHRDANDEPFQSTAEHDQDQAKSLATGANVAFIAGGVVIAVGVVWGLLDLRASSPRSATVVPWTRTAGASFSICAW